MLRATTLPLVVLLVTACGGPVPSRGDSRFFSPAARERGRTAYLEYCALCHGVAADGRGARQAAFTSAPRNFRDPAWRQSVTPEMVFERIRNGVPGTAMPPWRALGDATVADLTAYVLSVSRN